MNNVRVIAVYLPQFHRIKENDEIWGPGFTEWVNVAKARPLFKGHYQPQLPSELGFYDLTNEKARIAQADLAKQYGVEGFCYWHYWFGNGKRILDEPINDVIRTGKPNFPFCFAWANHSWTTSTWNNAKAIKKDCEFLKQEYLGVDDYIAHFNALLPAFKDPRYITVDGKLLFAIFDPEAIPDKEISSFINVWNKLAVENGLAGFHFVARIASSNKLTDQDAKQRINGGYIDYYNKYLNLGFDAIWSNHMRRSEILSYGYKRFWLRRAFIHAFKKRVVSKYDYKKIITHYFTKEDSNEDVYPMVVPRWDKTPRQGKLADIFVNSSPELFEKHMGQAVDIVKGKEPQHRIIFLQSWNEWGEGNYIEPDIKYGRKYLEALKKAIDRQ